MCKLYCVLDVEEKGTALKFTEYAIKEIIKTDNHGLGRVVLGDKGLLVNRWLDVRHRFGGSGVNAHLTKYEGIIDRKSNQAGVMSNRVDAILVHGRYATCEKTLENTHPFIKEGTALIHNGVISNHHAFKKESSTCDSEILLHQYLENKVLAHASNINQALEGVGGYYACMVANENGTVDIWRDNTASLYIGHVSTVGVVIATTQEIISSSAKKMRLRVTGLEEMTPCKLLRWKRDGSVQVTAITASKPFERINIQPGTLAEMSPYQGNGYKWWQDEEDEKIVESRQLEMLQTGKITGVDEVPFEG